MLGEEAVEVLSDVRSECGGAADAHIHVGREEFAGGGENEIVALRHEVQKMKLLFRPGQEAGAEPDALANANFLPVAKELGQRKTAKMVGFKILARHADELEQAARGSAEEMRVPHHIHVAHHVEIRLGDRGLVRNGKRSEIHAGVFSWSKAAKVLCVAAS